jgi:hypothetical protein
VSAVLLVVGGAPSAGQTAATGRIMRDKLTHAQAVLEALTTSNYEMLKSHSTALSKATGQAGWDVLRTPEYRRYSETFLRVTEDLVRAADARDMDLAMTHYTAMTNSCYQCHRYIRNARIAGR